MSADAASTAFPLLDSLSKSFEPKAIEAKWYPVWEKAGNFVPDRGEGDASKDLDSESSSGKAVLAASADMLGRTRATRID